MHDLPQDSAAPQVTRLADYTPPPFLIDTVDLAFDLGEDSTSVKARYTVRRNPAAKDKAANLDLDGEALELVSLTLDGEARGPNRYKLHEGGLTVLDVTDSFTLEIET